MSQDDDHRLRLERYLRASKKFDLSSVDWDEIPNHPLSDGT